MKLLNKDKGINNGALFENVVAQELFAHHIDLYYYNSKKYGERCRYLMFDEIQNVKDFKLVINSFRATHDISIFVTGSNSKLLSGELSTHLGGRTLSFRMLPFCFKEYAEFKAVVPTKELLIEYMEWGGLKSGQTRK